MTGYMVEIVRVRDNAVRLYSVQLPWEDHSLYMWTDGNFGCDCNRQLAFQRAGDEPESIATCGVGAYRAIRAILPDGTEIKIDEV